MKKKIILTLFIITIALFLVSCQQPKQEIANPSAVFCENNGFEYKITTMPDGSQSGICIVKLQDNTTVECDGWEYYRGECSLCGEYCKNQPHVMCVGEWNISGNYPECSCLFLCERQSRMLI